MSLKALLNYVLEEVAIDGEEGMFHCFIDSFVRGQVGGVGVLGGGWWGGAAAMVGLAIGR